MICQAEGKVLDIIKTRPSYTEIIVFAEGQRHRAINYNCCTGPVEPGDEVVLNTTATALRLGSGGHHFVSGIRSRPNAFPQLPDPTFSGHIIKLRYTPWQFAVLSIEEENSPYHEQFCAFSNLGGMPVIIGELHSMLLPVVFNLCCERPTVKIGYIMTDGGALPAHYSQNIAYLKRHRLIKGSITYGQAFGGDYEAVNMYTALIGAQIVLEANIAVVTMGPGITGTGTKYGFTGIEQGQIIDAVNTLGGRALFIPRISFADKRSRHRGISHHSLTVLAEIAHTPATVILPKLDHAKDQYLIDQLTANNIGDKHKIITVPEQDKVLTNLQRFPLKMTTMGRTITADKEFFQTAGSAGFYGSQLV